MTAPYGTKRDCSVTSTFAVGKVPLGTGELSHVARQGCASDVDANAENTLGRWWWTWRDRTVLRLTSLRRSHSAESTRRHRTPEGGSLPVHRVSADPLGITRIPAREKTNFGGVHIGQRCRADEHIVEDLAVDRCSNAGMTKQTAKLAGCARRRALHGSPSSTPTGRWPPYPQCTMI